jgi:hypothetical protein
MYTRLLAARRRDIHHVRSAVKLGDCNDCDDCSYEIPWFAHRLGILAMEGSES